MATARDWLKTLWNASYKGTPFFVERDEESGGRRIVIHQFPMRDTPYLEDLGEDKRDFSVTAYVASDNADADAGSLVAACASRGAGALVLPTHGPVVVRCRNFERQRAKDKHGYIAFRLDFTREGAAGAIASVPMLSNLIFVAAEGMASAIAASFMANIQLSDQAGFVMSDASDRTQDAFSALEVVRTTQPIDPDASAIQRKAIQDVFDSAPALIEDLTTTIAIPNNVVTIARALGDAMPPAASLTAFEALATDGSVAAPFYMEIISVSYPTPSRRAQAQNGATIARTLRLAALTAYSEAVARVALPDRPSAITLRANVVEYFEAELIDLPPSEIGLYHAIETIRDAVVEYLSRAVLDLAPVLTVEANFSMPSLYWAWRLYQDPNRSTQIVDRNRVAHPSFMPLKFEALAR